ncbi:SpoIIE family protein phosphatase [Actinomadura sp. LD22]|uniref:SpoIIE family protein phosphatase n=1 Tax=Actinomadura physcomitrii TaxID=2650748 RepID=A0A6I4MTC7_9ACTN|nr:SpoIIE family protein phosphatase [Actinomadura physcomitrii]MWA05556.1 SpoIIE family protein phosphatase [Actinomadura physcomitrii]
MIDYAQSGRSGSAASDTVRKQCTRVSSVMRDKAIVNRAITRLARKLNTRPSEAAEHLEQMAEHSGISLIEVAEGIEDTPHAFSPPELPDWIQGMLDTHDDLASYTVPITDSVGRVIDFYWLAVNRHGCTADGRQHDELVGKSLLEVSPGVWAAGLLDEFTAAYQSGVPFHRESMEYVDIVDERPWPILLNVRAARVLDGLLLNFTRIDERELFLSGWARVQHLAGLGWAEWELASPKVTWTPQTYEIFGREPTSEPISLEDLPAMAVPEDRPVLDDVIDSLLHNRESVQAEFSIQHRHGVRRLHVIGEPLLDCDGIPLKVRLLVQDLTAARHRERAVTRARERAAREQERTAEERRITAHLQNILLPPGRRLMDLPGLAVGVRYQAAERLARLGGDFFKARLIDDDQVLLVIGDAMGHGLAAASNMMQMRSGLAGLAYTGAAPDRLTTWLNELVLHNNREIATTGTAIVSRFDVAERTLSWANAGHLSPILIRGGHAGTLEGASGPLLGGVECDYQMNTTQLQPGDLLLLYTDGLVEQRNRDLGTGIQALVNALQSCTLTDPEDLIDCTLQRLGASSDDDICVLAARVL